MRSGTDRQAIISALTLVVGVRMLVSEKSDKSVVSLTHLPATTQQRRFALAVAAALLVGLGASAPFAAIVAADRIAATSNDPSLATALLLADFATQNALATQVGLWDWASAPMDRRSSSTMAFIAGGTFRMGSDKHYPEEAPSHRVTVDGFWIDTTPITNRVARVPKDIVTAPKNNTAPPIE
jgi:formylglycine-generating enzyme required for sulfatase activity